MKINEPEQIAVYLLQTPRQILLTHFTEDQIILGEYALGAVEPFSRHLLFLRHRNHLSLNGMAFFLRLPVVAVEVLHQTALLEFVRLLQQVGVIQVPAGGGRRRRPAPAASLTNAPRRSKPRKTSTLSVSCPKCSAMVAASTEEKRTPVVCLACGVRLWITRAPGRVPQAVIHHAGRNELIEEETPLGRADCYRLLGGSPRTPVAELKKAYLQKIQACHPDKAFHAGPERTAVAETMTRRLNFAWETIQSEHRALR